MADEIQDSRLTLLGDLQVKEVIEHPGKLLRMGGVVREMLEEARRAPLDEEGRMRARDMLRRCIIEIKSALDDGLRKELERITLPFGKEVPTQSELRIAQAQIVGWFEGLFHGMQAALMGQQMAAQMGPPFRRSPSQQEGRGPSQYL
ncbi:MAG: proteasome activator [Actinomycetota bacterium]